MAYNKHMSIRPYFVFLLALFFAFTVASSAHAATLSIDPPDGHFGPGDTFVATVRLDTILEECVNAVTVELNYSKDWMKASAISKGESFLTLWPEEPTIDLEHGIVRFEGGIPAGYCGRVQGDPGKTNIIAKVIFTIPGNMIGGKATSGPEPMLVTFGPATKVLLNDGFGTVAPLILQVGDYTRELSSLGLNNEWLDIVHADKIPPELFHISLEQDPQTYQGKYFIVFSTIDKQSGVHHYEVTEDDPNQFCYARGGKYIKADIITTKSPYVLTDQTLKSRVVVRAIDNAGNASEAVLAPQNGDHGTRTISSNIDGGTYFWWYVIGGTLLILIVISFWIFHRRRGILNTEVTRTS